MKGFTMAAMAAMLVVQGGAVQAQKVVPAPAAPRAGPPISPPLGNGPWDVATERGRVHISVVAQGLDHPWGLAFMPDGTMLVTERAGRLRAIRNGVLDPAPIAGMPDVYVEGIGGVFDIALHPKFARNHLVYIAYVKPGPEVRSLSTLAVFRARWDGSRLVDGHDIFVADAWYGAPPIPKRCCGQGPASGSHGGRLAFDRKGFLYVTVGDRNYGEKVQDPSNDFGKIVRLRDDGGIPLDNPFVTKAGYRPEIWTLGHRNPLGLSFDSRTGILWESEFGPRGGDEVNIIRKGANYGWIDVTQGAHYNDEPAKGVKNVPGFEDPILTWAPSINPGNVLLYHGARFPGWQGNLLMPDMTRSMLRVTFDAAGHPVGQERMLTELQQRLRDIRQGPDGNLYLLTDETGGAVLKLEPAK